MAENSSNKKKTAIIAVVIVVLLIVIGVLGVVIYNLATKEPEIPVVDRTASEGLIVDESSVNKKAEEATFTTDMNMIWTFASGNPVSTNAHIGNSAMNKYDVYFEIYLDDEQQTLLYSSPVIPVGKQLDELKLDKALPDGNYEALCTYHLLDDEDPTQEISKVSFNVTLMFINPNDI